MLLVGEAAIPDQSDYKTGVVPTRLLVLTWLPNYSCMHKHPGERPASCITNRHTYFIGHLFILT